MKKIKINFTDFWGGFNKNDNYFYNILSKNYDVEISDNPDYLFYSVFGAEFQKYNCTKIFFSGENVGPNFNECNYSMCYDYIDDERHHRLPLYILYGGYYDLINKKVEDNLVNRKFCNFIVTNGANTIRNDFFTKLSKYKHIDSGGRYLNNIGGPVGDKLAFQSDYKFSLTFENNAYRPSRDGYTTEKIFEPMKVNSIPIYWGNELIHKEFNSKSFINYHDFNNEDDLVEYIIELDNNDDKYMSMLKEPWLIDNKIVEYLKEERIVEFLDKIFK